MSKNNKISMEIKKCIDYINITYQVKLTEINIFEYMRYFLDNPQGRIENVIDSYMINFEYSDIENYILGLPNFNIS